jgi:ABC-type sulfate/molybdate transport systems ATPase subunit
MEAGRWLERMHVVHVADRRPAQLSGGEAQRVALARALAAQPQVLLLDEPFSALDFALRRQLSEELITLTRELAIPVLMVTHDRQDAAALGNQVVVLEQGRVVAVGAPPDVLPR